MVSILVVMESAQEEIGLTWWPATGRVSILVVMESAQEAGNDITSHQRRISFQSLL